MAKLLQALSSKISSWLRKKPLPTINPRRPQGYQEAKKPLVEGRGPNIPNWRGIAAESLPGRLVDAQIPSDVDILEELGDVDNLDWPVVEYGNFEQSEIDQWRMIPESEAFGFLHNYDVLPVSSSNVVAVQRLPATDELIVEFGAGSGGGSYYIYSNVSAAEADSFLKAPSKGSWVWSNLRIRGTKKGHRKPYRPYGGFVDPRTMQVRGGNIHSDMQLIRNEDLVKAREYVRGRVKDQNALEAAIRNLWKKDEPRTSTYRERTKAEEQSALEAAIRKLWN